MADRELRSFVGRSVVLYAAGTTERYSFVIDAATPTVTVLHPDDVDARRFAAKLQDGVKVTLGAPVSDGIFMADAQVEHWSPTVRVLTLSNPPSMQHVQRRAVFRVPVSYRLNIGVQRDDHMVFSAGETLDLSECGMAVTAKGLRVDPGESAMVSVQLNSGPLMMVGHVIVPGDGAYQPIRMHIDQIASSDFAQLAAELRQAEVRRVRTGAAASRG